MDIVVFDREEIVVVARALVGVATAKDPSARLPAREGVLTDAEAELVEGLALLHGVRVRARGLEPAEPSEVAAAVTDAHKRKRAVQLAIVAALVDGPNEARERAVRALAAALAVPESGVDVLSEVTHGHLLLARFDVVRRMRRFVMREGGLGAIFDVALPLLGLGEDAALAARYRALGDLPAGTLGHALYAHYVEHGFRFPGEPDGAPERMVFHDVGHVLSGYGVDPTGEIQQAAFQAGFVRNDGFLFLLFGILQFHVGIRLTPVAKPEKDLFDVPKVLRAAARGAACKVDFSDGFDLWAHVAEDLEELRARWGVAA